MNLRDDKAQAVADIAIERALRALFNDGPSVELSEDEFVILAANGLLNIQQIGNHKRAFLHGVTVAKTKKVIVQ